MSYQRSDSKKGSKMSVFWQKVCKNSLIKTDFFFQKSTFFESLITQKRSIFEHSYDSYSKRQKNCTLIVILVISSYLASPILIRRQSQTGYFLL